jgi:glutamate carboxypeptidase
MKKLNSKIDTFFNDNLKRYLDILQQMVGINSFTENADGVNQTGVLTAKVFSELGFTPEFVQSSNPDFGNHLVLTRPGASGKKVGLITHLDTVFPREEEINNDFSWRVEGDKIFGPGTNDIKGGTVMILMVLEGLAKCDREIFEGTTWVILANAAEERWSVDFGNLCRDRLGHDGLAALVFEAGYVDNNTFSMVAARKGMAVYDIHIEGKSAHAGNGHASGASAIVQMADVIHKIHNLTDYEKDLTYNVGVLHGGTVPNRVPHLATARGEMRAFSEEVFDEGIRNLLALNEDRPLQSHDGTFSCKVNIELSFKNAPWPRNPETDSLFSIWEDATETMGFEMIREERGGLSDGNQLWDFIPTIDGLGPSGMNAHCSERSPDGSKEQEFVLKSSFVPKASLNTKAIIRLLSEE